MSLQSHYVIVDQILKNENKGYNAAYDILFKELESQDQNALLNWLKGNSSLNDINSLPKIPEGASDEFSLTAFTGITDLSDSNINIFSLVDVSQLSNANANFGSKDCYITGYNNTNYSNLIDNIITAVDTYNTKRTPICFITNSNTYLAINVYQEKDAQNNVVYDRFDIAPIATIKSFTTVDSGAVTAENAETILKKFKISSSKVQTWIFHRTQEAIYCKTFSGYTSEDDIDVLPAVNTSNNGQILAVVNGEWASSSFELARGKFY